MSDSVYSEEKMLAHYKQLCAKRDAVYEKQKELRAKLDQANAKMEAARVEATQLKAELDKDFDQQWFAMKKEIAMLARSLSRPNGPLAS